jgi:hypothetical protein
LSVVILPAPFGPTSRNLSSAPRADAVRHAPAEPRAGAEVRRCPGRTSAARRVLLPGGAGLRLPLPLRALASRVWLKPIARSVEGRGDLVGLRIHPPAEVLECGCAGGSAQTRAGSWSGPHPGDVAAVPFPVLEARLVEARPPLGGDLVQRLEVARPHATRRGVFTSPTSSISAASGCAAFGAAAGRRRAIVGRPFHPIAPSSTSAARADRPAIEVVEARVVAVAPVERVIGDRALRQPVRALALKWSSQIAANR